MTENKSLEEIVEVDQLCRARGVKFVAGPSFFAVQILLRNFQ